MKRAFVMGARVGLGVAAGAGLFGLNKCRLTPTLTFGPSFGLMIRGVSCESRQKLSSGARDKIEELLLAAEDGNLALVKSLSEEENAVNLLTLRTPLVSKPYFLTPASRSDLPE